MLGADDAMYEIATPTLAPIFDLIAQVDTPHDLGTSPSGRRRVIPILGGEVRGARVQGRVLPGANDYQIIRSDNVLELEARYIIETSDGAQIFVINNGLRFGPADALARQARGELVDPALIYFRTIPRFETADTRYHWLMTKLFVCSGARFPDRVEIRFFEVS
jgi:Protein of unknown function (DUF3237)